MALLGYEQTVAPITHFGFPCMPRQRPFMRPGREAGVLEMAATGELGTVLGYYVPIARDRIVLGVPGYLNEARARMTFGYSNPGPKASLNIRYTDAMAYPTLHVLYSAGGSSYEDDPLISWLNRDYALGRACVPQTMGTSYSPRIMASTSTKFCLITRCMSNLVPQLGVHEAIVLFISGDGGVGNGG
ncbi:hypothetical protein BJY52DRAFT_1214362 [Lactarius psammicola]|nr:hypothetical protein BJY52DRAFT_1214362 [Lactarius psammicola]